MIHQWGWGHFEALNKAALRLWGDFDAVPMDVAEMTRFRPDLHVISAIRTSGKEPDCLHYNHRACSKGLMEMPSWWLNLLVDILDALPTVLKPEHDVTKVSVSMDKKTGGVQDQKQQVNAPPSGIAKKTDSRRAPTTPAKAAPQKVSWETQLRTRVP